MESAVQHGKLQTRMNISIITTCKSRLSHLKQTLGSWKDFCPIEIIVVDVNCPDRTKEWLAVSHPEVRCVSLVRDGFNLAQARNVGAKAANGNYLFFVDADITLGSGLRAWFEKKLQTHYYYKRAQDTPFEGIHEQGTFVCSRAAFEKIEGYDETFIGYGGEDHDMYHKLRRIGMRQIQIPKEYIVSLEHSDEMRTQHYYERNKFRQSIINRSYAALKEKLLEAKPRIYELPQNVRKRIWLDINAKMSDDFERMEADFTKINFLDEKWLPDPYYLEIKTQVSINIRRRTK